MNLTEYKVYSYGHKFEDDQLSEIIAKMKEADTIVIGSPLYWHNICGAVRNVLDRFYGLVQQNELSGKKMYFLFQGAAPEKWMMEAGEYTMRRFAGLYGMTYIGMAMLGLAVLLGSTVYGNVSVIKAENDQLEEGLDAIEDAIGKGKDSDSENNSQSASEEETDMQEGTSDNTIGTPDDFPAAYDFGSGKISDFSRDYMLKKMLEPEQNDTVLNTDADPDNIQVLYLWEEGNIPAKTKFTKDMTGYFDDWDFRPYVTAIPVRKGVTPKGAVVLMAGGAYQFRGNYTDSLPTAAALREYGFQTFIVDYRLSPYTQEEGALDVARAVRFI